LEVAAETIGVDADLTSRTKRNEETMSAAATAAGYLYASGRLRGREKREGESEESQPSHEHKPKARTERPRIEKPVRVAAVPDREDLRERSGPRKTPTIQYRTRRWKPEQSSE
jgi:hypothetical protein